MRHKTVILTMSIAHQQLFPGKGPLTSVHVRHCLELFQLGAYLQQVSEFLVGKLRELSITGHIE